MRKLKIALVITRLDRGGAPDLVTSLVNRLDTNRYTISLISGLTHNPARGIQNIREKGINLVFIPQLIRNINPILDVLALLKLYKLFKREKFDIVHTHTAKAGIVGRIAARLTGTKLIVHQPHGHNFYGYFGPLASKLVVILERIIAHLTDRIIALTELEKKDYIRLKVIQPEKITVINSGLDLDTYRKANFDVRTKRDELKIGHDYAVIGMISRLESVKGPHYFIEAASRVVKEYPKINFLVVGDGRLRDKLQSRCKKLNILDKFIFTGWREDISQILPILDILILPSLNEAVGRILIEAGVCGVPVVATKVGGIPEIVKDEQTGILVPPGDSYKLAKAIIWLLRDKETRQAMGESAKMWIDDKFSANTMANKISNLYEDLIINEHI